MNKYLFVLIICISVNIFSQNGFREGPTRANTVLLLPQGFSIGLLNSKGISGFLNDVSNISLMNPASLNHLKDYSFGLAYQFQTSIDTAWFAGIGTSRVQNYVPQSLGGVVHYNDFSFGIGFGQRYNGSLDFDPIPVTTANEPNGTGEYYYPKFENSLQTYTLSTAYEFKGIFTGNSNLSFGLKYILNRLYSYESIGNVSANASAFGSNFEVGVNYHINLSEENYFGIGISYVTSTRISDKMEYDGIETTNIPGSSYYQIDVEPFELILKQPNELSFDIVFKPISKLELLGRIYNIFWSSVSENDKDQLGFSSGVVYSFNSSLDASFGIYYTSKEYVEDYFISIDELYALYFTGGISFQVNFLKVDLAVADSHLFSGDYWEQTIGRIGLGIHL